MKLKKLLLVSASVMFSFLALSSLNLEANRTELTRGSQDLLGNNHAISLRKATTEGVTAQFSRTYVQNGIDADGKDVLRFVTAVKGEIGWLDYNVKVNGLDNNYTISPVASVYKGVTAEDITYFYNGTEFVSEQTEETNGWYLACYSIKFSSGDYADRLISAYVSNKTGISEAKSASLKSLKNENASYASSFKGAYNNEEMEIHLNDKVMFVTYQGKEYKLLYTNSTENNEFVFEDDKNNVLTCSVNEDNQLVVKGKMIDDIDTVFNEYKANNTNNLSRYGNVTRWEEPILHGTDSDKVMTYNKDAKGYYYEAEDFIEKSDTVGIQGKQPSTSGNSALQYSGNKTDKYSYYKIESNTTTKVLLSVCLGDNYGSWRNEGAPVADIINLVEYGTDKDSLLPITSSATYEGTAFMGCYNQATYGEIVLNEGTNYIKINELADSIIFDYFQLTRAYDEKVDGHDRSMELLQKYGNYFTDKNITVKQNESNGTLGFNDNTHGTYHLLRQYFVNQNSLFLMGSDEEHTPSIANNNQNLINFVNGSSFVFKINSNKDYENILMTLSLAMPHRTIAKVSDILSIKYGTDLENITNEVDTSGLTFVAMTEQETGRFNNDGACLFNECMVGEVSFSQGANYIMVTSKTDLSLKVRLMGLFNPLA